MFIAVLAVVGGPVGVFIAAVLAVVGGPVGVVLDHLFTLRLWFV